MAFNQDFATTTSHPPLLLEELEADPLPLTMAIDSVEYFPDTDLTRIVWNATPSGAEQTAASNVVAAHDAAPMPLADQALKVESRSLTAPPGSPSLRDSYIVASPATGAWVGMEKHIATWAGDGWTFYQEATGITAFVDDENLTVAFDMTGEWTALSAKRNINATAAPTATDDKDSGYSVGSHWVDVSADKGYLCVDSTVGAAVWEALAGAHALGGAEHSADTLANLNAKVSDATLDDASAARTPVVHDLSGAAHAASTLANLNTKISDANVDDAGDARPPTAHNLGGAGHSADTLANLNAKVSDATLDDAGAARPPTAHTHPNADLTGVPGAGIDTTAIHDNKTGEISAVTEKVTPVAADLLIIEDSAAANAKKRVQIGNLPGGGGGDNIQVNGAAASDANFSDTTPAAPAGEVNVKFQKDTTGPDNISASVQETTATVKGVIELATQGEVDGGTDIRRAVTPVTLAAATTVVKPGDAAGGDLGGTYPDPTVDDGADGSAIHDDTAGEINAVATKATPVSADVILLEDSENSFAKAKVTLGSLPFPTVSHTVTIALEDLSSTGDGQEKFKIQVPEAGWVLSEVAGKLRVAGTTFTIQLREIQNDGTDNGDVLTAPLAFGAADNAQTTAFARSTPAADVHYALDIDVSTGAPAGLSLQLRFKK